MRIRVLFRTAIAGFVVLVLAGCQDDATAPDRLTPETALAARGGGGGRAPGDDAAGNNLSFPVLWAEGVAKTLPGTPGMQPILSGEWWYQWGTNGVDPEVTPASCPPDPDQGSLDLNPDGLPLCDDEEAGTVDLTSVAGTPAADNPLPLVRAYLQKDPLNVWQAAAFDVGETPLHVQYIDWGDNLESVDWYTRSQVRTEVVLFQDLTTPALEYEMRHTAGWGIDEVHGVAASLNPVAALTGPGTRATVYSHCARLTIQKLLVDRTDVRLADLEWVPGEGWTEPELDPTTGEPYASDLINEHIFNGSVHEGGDGPAYYSAEINVKGRIIFGYTWNVRRLNDMTPLEGSTAPTAAGDYRITFSLDETCGTASLNTYLDQAQILLPLEEEVVTVTAEGEDDTGGATAVLRGDLNLTHIDVRILERGGGGGGGPQH